MTTFEFDAHDLKSPRRKRISTITGKPTALNPETELQIQCFVNYTQRCRLDRDLRMNTVLYAVGANAGKRPLHQAVLAKRMGEMAGVWDGTFLDWRRERHRFRFIEWKSETGRLTKEQIEFRDKLAGTIWEFHVVREIGEFLEIIA